MFDYLADSSLLNRQDERGLIPLMWAAAFGEKAMVDFLLENVSDISRPLFIEFNV